MSVLGFSLTVSALGLASAETFFAGGALAVLAESPQPAITAAAAASMVQRVMTTSEGTVSEFPPDLEVYTWSDAKLVR